METVTISKARYQTLVNDSKMLESLEIMGVDNWQGYDDAISYYQEQLNEDLNDGDDY